MAAVAYNSADLSKSAGLVIERLRLHHRYSIGHCLVLPLPWKRFNAFSVVGTAKTKSTAVPLHKNEIYRGT